MASTTFVDNSTPVIATWLNDINSVAYSILGNGTIVPATTAAARTNLSAAKSGANTDITSLSSPAIAAATATTQLASDKSTKVATTALTNAAGRVLQMATTSDAGSSSAVITATPYNNLSVSSQGIIPLSAASKILVECVFNGQIGNVGGVNTTGTFQLYDAINTVVIGSPVIMSAFSAAGGVGVRGQQVLKAIVNNAALTARAFTLRGSTNDVGAILTALACVWTITEIAA